MRNFKKFLVVGLLAWQVGAVAHATTANVSTPISAPKQSYPLLYTVNAKFAGLVRSVNGYHITLHGTEPQVVFKNAEGKSGVVSIQQFVKYLQNKSAVIKADVTGVQVNQKNMGQETFNSSFILSKVVLSTRDNILRFEATPENPEDLRPEKLVRFDNATVFINGCSVCECSAANENCVG
jgi:hypothetical protein